MLTGFWTRLGLDLLGWTLWIYLAIQLRGLICDASRPRLARIVAGIIVLVLLAAAIDPRAARIATMMLAAIFVVYSQLAWRQVGADGRIGISLLLVVCVVDLLR